MRFNLTSRNLLITFVLLGVFSTNLRADEAPKSILEKGIVLFRDQKYKAAIQQLKSAADKQPNNVETQLWLGLALEADEQPLEAMAAWRSGNGNAKWEPIADYLKGLSWWKMNRANDATACLKDALVNLTDGKSVQFQPARDALAKIKEGEPAPEVSSWPDLSTLAQVSKNLAGPKGSAPKPVAAKKTAAAKKPVVNKKPIAAKSKLLPKTTAKTPPTSGTKPRAGKWVATVSNGYKGDVLTFRVSADGKRVEKVEFKGYWQNKERTGPEILQNLDPPSAFAVSGGTFSAVQQVVKSRMWWEFIGVFKTATTAEGTYRCAYAGGDNDTYKLKWTAHYVSP